jgi:Putative beta-barrel porin-2, OmpL-like. bbp2
MPYAVPWLSRSPATKFPATPRCRPVTGIVCLGLATLATTSAASAMNGPAAIQIDGGPLGPLQFSGGVDGYGYTLTAPEPGTNSTGVSLANALIELQKTSGTLQATVEIGAYSTQALGEEPVSVSKNPQGYFPESPLFSGYLTIAPSSEFSLSFGQFAPLVGFEGTQDWDNANVFVSEISFVEPGQGRGAQAMFNKGKFSASVSLTDGYYTGVFNYLQWLLTYTPNSSNNFNLFEGTNLGQTGSSVGGSGNVLLDNSTMLGGFYTHTAGNLSVTPEFQYQYTPEIAKLGIDHPVSNLAAVVFMDYQFGTSPWSLGGFVEYATQFVNRENASNASMDYFGFGPGSNLTGISLTPTWQYKNLFVRADAGFLHVGHGNEGTEPNQFSGLLEAGVLF